jgi:transposase-like protein
MVLIAVTCPYGQSDHIAKRGNTDSGQQRYRCQNPNCPHPCFLLDPAYKGRLPQIKEQVIDMALNGSGIRDAARVLGISTDTVINELKKRVKPDFSPSAPAGHLVAWRCGVVIRRADEAAPDQAPGSQDDLLLQVHSDARYGHRFVCQSV